MKLGKFGHHPDPATDFCIEVDELEGRAYNRKVAFDAEPDLERRIERALTFLVGGDPCAVSAKARLRKLQVKLPAPSPPEAIGTSIGTDRDSSDAKALSDYMGDFLNHSDVPSLSANAAFRAGLREGRRLEAFEHNHGKAVQCDWVAFNKAGEMKAHLAAAQEEIARLRGIVRGYKSWGTDGCRTCESGRVTLFLWNEQCTECDPEGYDRKAALREGIAGEGGNDA